jgi:CcmD family protein
MAEGLGWVLAVNLVLWTGLFLYMLRLGRRLRAAERALDGTRSDAAAPGGRER